MGDFGGIFGLGIHILYCRFLRQAAMLLLGVLLCMWYPTVVAQMVPIWGILSYTAHGKIPWFLCEEGLRIVSLLCDSSPGKLEAADLPTFGIAFYLVGSGEQRHWIVVSVRALWATGLLKLHNRAADQPLAGARLWAVGATHANSSILSVCLAFCVSPSFCSSCPVEEEAVAVGLRSCTDRELGESVEIFQAQSPDSGSCLPSFSIPGSKSEKKALSCNTGQSCSQRPLC